MGLSSRLLYADEIVTVRHVCCCPHDHVCGGPEATPAHVIAFPLQGVFVKHLDDGREVVAHPGQAVFFNSGECYRVSHPLGGDDCFVLELPESLLREILRVHDPRSAERKSSPFQASHVQLSGPALLRQRALRRNVRATCTALAIEERALELVADALSATPARESCGVRGRLAARRRREQVSAITVLLASEPARPWTLDELAREVHGSPFHLARVFRGEQGSSIHQYLLHVRLTYALDAVLDSGAPLTTISLDAGFATPSHFAAAFHARYGVAPSSLRRSLRTATARELRRISTAANGTLP
ncbi:MAG: helix-turn-helix transcriptional regulator [Rhodanobacteraceae bacterium]